MIVPWLIYCLLVSTLLAGAALLAERALRAQGWPTRWAWAGALAGSLALPAATWLLPALPAPAALPGLPGAYVMESLPALTAAAPTPAGLDLTAALIAGWIGASTLLLVHLALSWARLWSRGRGWRRDEVDGVAVLVSRGTGPAALGLWRARVVVPEWALSLDERLRRLLVLHEAEHVRARDPQLALAGLVACALMPWNPLLWWQLSRLRLAIEIDCDARVLERSGDRSGYGSLLLEVGQRRPRLAVALAESSSMLERRIRMIASGTKGRATLRAVALAAVSGVVLAVACETPAPTELAQPERGDVEVDMAARGVVSRDADRPAPTLEDVMEKPTFTPMTVRPQLKNAAEVQRTLMEKYPPLLRDAGIGGTVNVWFLIAPDGRVAKRQINLSSGRSALDMAAIEVADVMEFTPGYNGEEPVPVWVALDIRFDAGQDASPELRQPTVKGEKIERTAEEEAEILRRMEETTGELRRRVAADAGGG